MFKKNSILAPTINTQQTCNCYFFFKFYSHLNKIWIWGEIRTSVDTKRLWTQFHGEIYTPTIWFSRPAVCQFILTMYYLGHCSSHPSTSHVLLGHAHHGNHFPRRLWYHDSCSLAVDRCHQSLAGRGCNHQTSAVCQWTVNEIHQRWGLVQFSPPTDS